MRAVVVLRATRALRIRGRNGVIPLATPGVAPKETAQTQPRAPRRAVHPDGLQRVRGARGVVPARRRRPWGYGRLVEPDQAGQELCDHIASTAPRTSPARSSNLVSYAFARARISTSATTPLAPSSGRTRRRPISRSLRLSRFRSTIPLPCFPTMTPSREKEAGEGAKKTSRLTVLLRFPRSRISRISLLRRMRADLASLSPGPCPEVPTSRPRRLPAASDPSAAGGKARRGRRGSSSWRETRACSPACDCGVCRSASSRAARFMGILRLKTSLER